MEPDDVPKAPRKTPGRKSLTATLFVPTMTQPQSPRSSKTPAGATSSAGAEAVTLFTLELDLVSTPRSGRSLERRRPTPASPTTASSTVASTTLVTPSSMSSAMSPGGRNAAAIQVDDVLTEFPSSDPESPAILALALANEKADPSLLDKRMRIGKTKLGRTKYKDARGFKKPEGNEINVQHEQYALTYGMMCGILNSAGLQNPFKRKLTMDDFMRVDKHSFPASAKLQHPFKFKDYSPDIFRQIRRRFCIDSADYMVTLCGDFNFIEFMSNSKSGQFFFYSHDGRFMIKTQTKDESKFLRRILPHYYKFVMENPNTLITRFYGMHRVKMHHLRRKMHFIIMASVFDTPLEIHGRFDLKGSKVGRRASTKERNSNGVLKDMDLLDSGFRLQMGAERRAMLLVQVRKDVEFLQRMKIMDYSMLIGIHDSRQTIQTKIYAQPPAVNAPAPAEDAKSKSLPTTPIGAPGATAESEDKNYGLPVVTNRMTRAASVPKDPTSLETSPGSSDRFSDPSFISSQERLDSDSDFDSDASQSSDELGMTEVVDGATSETVSRPDGVEPISPSVLEVAAFPGHSESAFCRDEGGIYGRGRDGHKNGFVYFLGIIDILQQYNTRKIAETFFKGFRHNRKQISSVHPNFYGDRFIEFIEKHVVQDDTLPVSPVFAEPVPVSRMNAQRPINSPHQE